MEKNLYTSIQDYNNLHKNIYRIINEIEDPSYPDPFEGDTDLRDEYLEQLGNFPCDFELLPLSEIHLTSEVDELLRNGKNVRIDNHTDNDVIIKEFEFLDSHFYYFRFYDSIQIVYPVRHLKRIINFNPNEVIE